mgnify:CR=1 FL=1|jgi:hypothetical protein
MMMFEFVMAKHGKVKADDIEESIPHSLDFVLQVRL